jgi:hypothetical protein
MSPPNGRVFKLELPIQIPELNDDGLRTITRGRSLRVREMARPDLREEHALVNDNNRRCVLCVLPQPPYTSLDVLAEQRRG